MASSLTPMTGVSHSCLTVVQHLPVHQDGLSAVSYVCPEHDTVCLSDIPHPSLCEDGQFCAHSSSGLHTRMLALRAELTHKDTRAQTSSPKAVVHVFPVLL